MADGAALLSPSSPLCWEAEAPKVRRSGTLPACPVSWTGWVWGRLDRGDILLLLVLIYLFRETDDDEWLIILALVLLMGL